MSLEQDVGKLQGQMEKIESQIQSLQHNGDMMNQKLDKITDIVSQAKGGYKVMILLSAFFGACGAAIFKFLTKTLT